MRKFQTYADLDIHAWLEPAGGGVRLVLEGPKMREVAPELLGMRLRDGAGRHIGYATFRPVSDVRGRFTYELAQIIPGLTPPEGVTEWSRPFGYLVIGWERKFKDQPQAASDTASPIGAGEESHA